MFKFNHADYEKMNTAKLLLVLGCERSGTSLLAAMLGRHSEINMLCESVSHDALLLFGKKYKGNKLLLHRQIRMKQRGSWFGDIVNRVVNLHFWGNKRHKYNVFPTSRMSIEDYIKLGANIVFIYRKPEPNVQSIMNRGEVSRKTAEKIYCKAAETASDFIRGNVSISFLLYHVLTRSPQTEIMEVCKFLGLKFEPGMMNGCKYNYGYKQDTVIPRL